MNFREASEGIVFVVRVIPNSKCSEIVGWENDFLKVRIAAVPDKGKANDELVRFLSKHFKVSKSHITILQGHTSRQKKVCIEGISPSQLEFDL